MHAKLIPNLVRDHLCPLGACFYLDFPMGRHCLQSSSCLGETSRAKSYLWHSVRLLWLQTWTIFQIRSPNQGPWLLEVIMDSSQALADKLRSLPTNLQTQKKKINSQHTELVHVRLTCNSTYLDNNYQLLRMMMLQEVSIEVEEKHYTVQMSSLLRILTPHSKLIEIKYLGFQRSSFDKKMENFHQCCLSRQAGQDICIGLRAADLVWEHFSVDIKMTVAIKVSLVYLTHCQLPLPSHWTGSRKFWSHVPALTKVG